MRSSKRESPSSGNFAEIRVRRPERPRPRPRSPVLSTDTNAPTTRDLVDYSHYVPRKLLLLGQANADDFFRGIIHYIVFHSNGRYNTGEMIIQYAGRQPNSDPANILDSRNPDLYESGNGTGQCLLIRFFRIAIRPTALAIRSGPLNRTTRHLTSYVFQGRQRGGDWVVLDERHSLLEYLPGYPSRLSHIDTDMEFSEFRLLQTDPAVSPATHFSINALEIHGAIRPLDTQMPQAPVPEMTDEFDPWAISDYD